LRFHPDNRLHDANILGIIRHLRIS
jgi:hypothetical protein